MKTRIAIFSCFLALYATGRETTKPDTVETLRQRITALIQQPRYSAAEWGVKILSLDSGKTLFEHNAGKLLSPASNSKLYTMAMALDRLGPDYQIKTSVYAAARPDTNGTVTGDLLIYGRGDPTINARLHGGDIFKALDPLVSALTNAGVKQITGDIIGDDSFFRSPPFGPGWEWEDFQDYYGAEISALTINDNTLQLQARPGEKEGDPCRLTFFPATTYVSVTNRTRTVAAGTKKTINLYRPVGENLIYVSGRVPLGDPGSDEDVTMHDPAGLFAFWFREALTRHGITVTGPARSMHWKDREEIPLDLKAWVELGSMESLPVREIMGEVMKPSQNLYTDLMLEHVGAHTAPGLAADSGDTVTLGIRELSRFLSEAGVKHGETIFDEGSGLSRDNLTTPNATVTLLDFMSHHQDAAIYKTALPIAGIDGTLRRRMKGTAAAGNVRAKTGSLRWANSLSGYVTTAAAEHLAFSLMLNRYNHIDPASAKTADLDAIAEMLAGFSARTELPGK